MGKMLQDTSKYHHLVEELFQINSATAPRSATSKDANDEEDPVFAL